MPHPVHIAFVGGVLLGCLLGVAGTQWWTRAPSAVTPVAESPPAPPANVAAPPAAPPTPPRRATPAVPSPADTPPHALQTPAALRALVDAAIRRLGVVGEVAWVDCSEPPCIVYGAVDLERSPRELFASPPFVGAKRVLFQWPSDGENSPYAWHHFAAAWIPPELEAPAVAELKANVSRRYRQVRVADGPPIGAPDRGRSDY